MANEFKKLHNLFNRIKISSLNKAGRSATSRVTRLVREGYNIQKKWIDDRLKETQAKKITDPVYKIAISSASIPLILFKPKQLGKLKPGKRRRKNRKAGVKVRIKKKEPTFISGGFIAAMEYGKNAFKRESAERGPVFALKAGPQVSQLFTSDIAMKAMEDEAVKRFEEIFFQRLEYESSELDQ